MSTEVPAGKVIQCLIEGAESLDEFSTLELETAKMYLSLLESTLEMELSERYGRPIDVAEDNAHQFIAVPEPPNWRATCSCSWKDRRLVPSEKQAEYAWKGNHEEAVKRV